ncbi:MAG TPA: hypothetical protein VGK48_09655 [Terriglobia bacterium]|jgi:hypothetical protein
MRIGYVLIACLLVLFSISALPQNRKDKKEAQLAESAKPKNVAGGVKFQVQKSYAESYDVLLNWVKRADYTIESADKENGLISTAMTITGGYSQTGTRLMLTLIKDTDTATTVRVVVTDQKRKKLLTTEPWSDPKVNQPETQRVADNLKSTF